MHEQRKPTPVRRPWVVPVAKRLRGGSAEFGVHFPGNDGSSTS
jgi:hypothetical protein